MSSSLELEEKLLKEMNKERGRITYSFLKTGISISLTFLALNLVAFFLIRSILLLFIHLPIVFFIEAGIAFVIAGSMGTLGTSVTLRSILNNLFGREDDSSSFRKSWGNSVTYSITGICLLLYTAIFGLLWENWINWFF